MATNFPISRLQPHQYDECRHLHAACFPGKDEECNKFLSFIQKGKNLHKLAIFDTDGNLVGYLLFNNKTGYLSWLAVTNAHRGCGLGSRLLAQALRDGGKLGLERFILDVKAQNKLALRFYLKNDFDIVGCFLNPQNAMMVRMAKFCPP